MKGDFSGGSVKNPPAMQEVQETQVQSLDWEDPMDKEMVTHSSILPGWFNRQRRLLGYSLRGSRELDMTEQLTLSLS